MHVVVHDHVDPQIMVRHLHVISQVHQLVQLHVVHKRELVIIEVGIAHLHLHILHQVVAQTQKLVILPHTTYHHVLQEQIVILVRHPMQMVKHVVLDLLFTNSHHVKHVVQPHIL